MTLYGWNEAEDSILERISIAAQALYLRGFRTLPVNEKLVAETTISRLAYVQSVAESEIKPILKELDACGLISVKNWFMPNGRFSAVLPLYTRIEDVE